MRRARTRALAVLAAGLLFAGATRAADTFYVGQLEAGSREILRGNYPAAAQKLRVACFGLLDQPSLLIRGLLRLALAQAGSGDDAGLGETFDRLLEVEATFGAYSALADNSSFKRDFERLLPRHFSASELEAIPAFAHVAAGMRQARLEALPPKRLRRELERRLSADPEDAEALVLMTRFEIAQGRDAKAEQRLVGLLAANPENRMARCLYGKMKLRRDECAAAMEDLSWCSRPPADEVLGARYLRCLVKAADWQAAGGYLASLPLDLRSREEVANLILAIPPETLENLTRTPDGEPTAIGSGDVDAAGQTAPPSNFVAELRQTAAATAERQELDALFRRAAEQANGRPDHQELQYLAAELAYRRGDYPAAVRFFRRGGRPGLEQPLLRFYLAVSLYETGEARQAADVLAGALPRLEATPFVERYRELILASAEDG